MVSVHVQPRHLTHVVAMGLGGRGHGRAPESQSKISSRQGVGTVVIRWGGGGIAVVCMGFCVAVVVAQNINRGRSHWRGLHLRSGWGRAVGAVSIVHGVVSIIHVIGGWKTMFWCC